MQDAVDEDPYLWLEDVEGQEALAWVETQNKLTLDRFQPLPLFSEIQERSLSILDSKDKLTYPQFVGDQVFNFWRDSQNVRGLIRQMPLVDYLQGSQNWETVLDIDALAESEDENWVYKGQQILAPENQRSMLWLSRGGSDACVIREFDLPSKTFVENGFQLPEAKSDVSWKDADTLYVGTASDPESSTESGYPRVVKQWKRGTPLTEATLVFEVQSDDLSAGSWVVRRDGQQYEFLSRSIDFWNEEIHWIGETQVLLPLPTDAPVKGLFKGQLLICPRSQWILADEKFSAGSLLSLDLTELIEGRCRPQLVFDPEGSGTVESVSCLQGQVLLTVTRRVQTSLMSFRFEDGLWQSVHIGTPVGGTASVAASSSWRNDFFFTHEDFLVPTQLSYHGTDGQVQPVQSLPSRFLADGLDCEQLWVESADGTQIPYYIIGRSELATDSSTPAILYGYGGFEVSLLPTYLSLIGNNWLSRGGIYISANIRGGGEFGPSWHQAALKENRFKAFEDFEAVAKDVVARGYTRPENLAVHGGSNGGLLTGAMLTRSPHLFGAVIIGVPLLDMLRYHKLLAGASWMAEYGDPDVPSERAYLKDISPYHRLEKGRHYPPVLLYTSTKDDRVHPGHARKMVAKLREYGYDVDYYENTEGGHAGASNNEQQAFLTAVIYTYLWEKLGR